MAWICKNPHDRLNKKRLVLLDRDGDRCWLCGEPFSNQSGRKPSLEHVIPKSKGGTMALNNLKLTHSRCNYKRGDNGFIPTEQPVQEQDKI